MFGEVPMARTLYRKILDKHVVRAIDANTVLLYVDLHFANEYTSPQAFAGLVERGVKAPVPDAHLCVRPKRSRPTAVATASTPSTA